MNTNHTDGPGNAPAETLTQAELDTLECGEPGCTSHDHSVIYMNCNRCSWDDQRLAVCYEKASGEMLVECRERTRPHRRQGIVAAAMKGMNAYNPDGKEKRRQAREEADNKCIRCGHPNDHSSWHVLTTHHFDGNKANDVWWNLLALCQRCHLSVQNRVNPHVPYFLEHSEWLKPYVAGFYAFKYEGRLISRAEAIARLDELLALERKIS